MRERREKEIKETEQECLRLCACVCVCVCVCVLVIEKVFVSFVKMITIPKLAACRRELQ